MKLEGFGLKNSMKNNFFSLNLKINRSTERFYSTFCQWNNARPDRSMKKKKSQSYKDDFSQWNSDPSSPDTSRCHVAACCSIFPSRLCSSPHIKGFDIGDLRVVTFCRAGACNKLGFMVYHTKTVNEEYALFQRE